MLADLAGKVEECEVAHPVVIVDQFGPVGCCTVEIKKVAQLGLDAGFVVSEHLFGQQVALGAFARRVANHACGAADEGERLVAGTLEVAQNHDGAEVSDVERVGRRVKAHVSRDLLAGKQFFRARHELVYHAAPSEFVNKIHRFVYYLLSVSLWLLWELRAKVRLFFDFCPQLGRKRASWSGMRAVAVCGATAEPFFRVAVPFRRNGR